MNIVSIPLNFIYETLIRPISSFIFKPLKLLGVFIYTTNHDEAYRLENTAEIPHSNAGDHSNLVVNIHDAESNRQQSVTTATSSESATTQNSSYLTRLMKPQPAANAAPYNENQSRKWLNFILATYLTAIAISLQALETIKTAPELSESSQFHYFRTFLVISLVYLTISAFFRPFSLPVALVILRVAVLFGFLAFILIITISDFPTEVIKVSSATFIVSLSIIFLATYLWGGALKA